MHLECWPPHRRRVSASRLLQGIDEREALMFMERYETGTSILKTERAFFQWTYLMSVSNRRFIEAPDIRQSLKGSNPDARLDEMMRPMANAAGGLFYVGRAYEMAAGQRHSSIHRCCPYNAKLVAPPQILL